MLRRSCPWRSLPTLTIGLAAIAGCSFNETIEPPDYAQKPSYSLCDYGRPITVSNRGIYDSRSGRGELLLAAQLSKQPVESLLGIDALRLEFVADTGLQVTSIRPGGAEHTELIPSDWIRCADGAMELTLASDAFYIWASIGVKTRRLRLQVATDDSLLMQHIWQEKGVGAFVIPLKFTGDGWASFLPRGPAGQAAPVNVASPPTGGCAGLQGRFSANGTSVRLDGSVEARSAEAQFFRPEITGQPVQTDAPAVQALRITQTAEGGIGLTLMREDGTSSERWLEASRVACAQGRWNVNGKKNAMSPLLLLMGTGGTTWEDLVLWRDVDGALMVRGTYRTRGALFLIPAGNTSELFMRYELAPARDSEDEQT